jgi:hypothetical protein
MLILYLEIETFWYGTFNYICDLIHNNLNIGRSEEVNEVHLAREMARDFLRNWSSTKEPIPWLRSNTRMGIPPPINLNSI